MSSKKVVNKKFVLKDKFMVSYYAILILINILGLFHFSLPNIFLVTSILSIYGFFLYLEFVEVIIDG